MDELALDNGSEVGALSREDFEFALQDQEVRLLLSAMELDVNDARLVFDLTDDGDGSLGAEEMAAGFSRLKGQARTVDMLALTKNSKDAHLKIDTIMEKFNLAYKQPTNGQKIMTLVP